jgi:hypothetical protein
MFRSSAAAKATRSSQVRCLLQPETRLLLILLLSFWPDGGPRSPFPSRTRGCRASDRRVRLLSSSTYPLSQHASLVLTPPPPAAILDAARHLRIGTTFDSPSSSSTASSARAQPIVSVAVQDFAVCLLTEGGGSSEAGRKGRGKSDTFSSTPQVASGESGPESAPWIVVLELFVPWLSVPPLDRTAVRCRSLLTNGAYVAR